MTAANFEAEVLKSPLPVLLDFWADWCMPCKMIGPHIEQIAVANAGKLKVGKVNVDQEPDLAGKFNIISIPSLLVFKGGQLVKQQVGALPKNAIEAMIKEFV